MDSMYRFFRSISGPVRPMTPVHAIFASAATAWVHESRVMAGSLVVPVVSVALLAFLIGATPLAAAQSAAPARAASTVIAPVLAASAVATILPQIEGTTIDGKPFKLASLKGKVVLVMFWSTGCAVITLQVLQNQLRPVT